MKKIIAVLLSVLLVLSVGMLFVSADETEAIDVHVTIVDEKSQFALAYETVTVTDIDGDSALTINDALYAAHEQFYDGGAEAGYATETTKWGLSLMKLWGVANGGSYGYLVNNSFAWSMTDPVQADDYIAAFIYTDTEDFSDVYTYFEPQYAEGETSVEVELKLMKTGFDEQGTPFVEPVADAQLLVNGEPDGKRTDSEGKAYVGFGSTGEWNILISATVADERIVPPVCIINIKGNGEATPDQPDPTEAATSADDKSGAPTATKDESEKREFVNDGSASDESTADQSTNDSAAPKAEAAPKGSANPQTGDVTNLILWIVIAAVCLAGIVGVVVFYKKRYGKK